MSTLTEEINEVSRAVAEIEHRARHAQKHPRDFWRWSTGERLAVALALNKPAWLKEMGCTALEAVERIGPEWHRAAVIVQRRLQ